MSKIGLIPAQKAMRSILLADATLVALLNTGPSPQTGVYDGVPDAAPYPYIAFGEKHSQPWDVFGSDGVDEAITIYVWSRALGDTECLTIASRMNELLHGVKLNLTSDGFSNVIVLLDMLDTMREPDGLTRKSISRYKFQSQEP